MPFSLKQIIIFCAMMAQFAIIAQQVEATDKKGNIININNNRVTTSGTAPSAPLQNDIWFDTSAELTKIYDGTTWLTINLDALAKKEDSANKSTDTNLSDATNTKFPTELAVKSYVDAEVSAISEDNIYNTNGSLTGNRAVSQANFDLNFDANTLVVSGNDDRVGIGIESPTDKLHVAGNLRIDGGLRDKDGEIGSTGQVLSSTVAGVDWVDASSGATLTGGGLGMIWAEENSALNASTNSGFQFSFGNGATSTNGVVVGYESLVTKLSFSSETVATGEIELYVNGSATGRTISINSEVSKIVAITELPLSESDRITFRTISGSGGRKIVIGLVLQTNGVVGPQGPPGDAGGDDQTASEVNITDLGANFTTTNVEGALAELAALSQDNIYSDDGTLTANRAVTQGNFDLTFDANTLVVSGDDNRVGIGTATPSAKLDVNGNARVRTLPTGNGTDEIVTTDANGNLRKLPITSLETNSSISQNTSTGVVIHTSEDGSSQAVNIVSANTNNSISVGTDGGAYYNSPIKAYGKLIPASNSYTASGISGVIKNGTGRFTLTMSTTRSGNNYPIQLNVLETGTNDVKIYVTAQTTTTFSIAVVRTMSTTTYVDKTFYFSVLDY